MNPSEGAKASAFLKSLVPYGDFLAKRREKPELDMLCQTVESQSPLVFGLLANFFHEFCSSGGLDAVLDLVVPERLHALDKGASLDLETASSLLYPLTGAAGVISEPVAKMLAETTEKSVLACVSEIDPRVMKDISIKSLNDGIDSLERVLRLSYDTSRAGAVIEGCHMTLSLKMIQCPYLDRQLKGVADIKRQIDYVAPKENAYIGLKADSSQAKGIERTLDWIKRNRVLQLVFNDNVHAEMIKRGTAILLFVAKYDTALGREVLDLVWNCQLNKYEDIVRAIYETIESIIDQISSSV